MNRSPNSRHSTPSNPVFHFLLFVLLFILVVVPSLEAAIVKTGNVEPGGTWTSSTIGYVGNTSDGSVLVDKGSVLQSYCAYIAYNSGVSATATITGAGSKWTNDYDLYVGQYGSGTLRIEAGGQVSNSTSRSIGYLGFAAGSSGTVIVTGTDSKWTNSPHLYVGNQGFGTLSIEAGGLVGSFSGYVGHNPGSSGTVTVTGVGSMWGTLGAFYVGEYGSGTLRIEAGGQVSTDSGGLGYYPGSFGSAVVTGTGSKWINGSSLYVGRDGSGTLTVADGGEVTAQMLYASIGNLYGNGTITATKGAVLDANLRYDAAHPTQAPVVFGSSGTLTVNAAGGNLGAGYKGNGSLTVAEGVAITSSNGYLGYYAGSSGTATIIGAGSTWNNNYDSYVGYRGAGTLRIEAGGQVGSSSGHLGCLSGSSGTVTVIGVGSMWSTFDAFYVGEYGSGTLRIEAGAQVSNSNGYLGYDAGSLGTATVTGTGSKWINNGYLYVGRGGAGTLTVAEGGEVVAQTLYASLESLLGNGTITAQGAVLDADFRFDTAHPTQATIAFGSGGTLTVSATGGILGAGYKGNGSLTVSEGTAILSSMGYLGHNSVSSGTATITGKGSKWTNSSDLCVGYKGTGTLHIEAGGQVTSSYTYLGYSSGSSGTATVTGTGSLWTNSSSLRIGYNGFGTLRIEEGGQVASFSGHLGYLSGSSGTATITGAGSKWTSFPLYVGYEGVGTLRIEAGGETSNSDSYVACRPGSSGTATVSGAGSKWTSTSLRVGDYGIGTFRIEAGGQVSSSSSSVGNRSGSIGTATVTGAGSIWTNSESLSIGSSGNGTLHIRDGGLVTASSVSVNSNSLLTLDAGYSSNLRVGSSGTGTITNNGIIRVLTGPQPAAGSQYSPVTAAMTWSGTGAYQALGGTWNATNHVFTVSQSLGGVSGTPVTIDLTQRQRVLVEDTAKNRTVGASFLAKTGTGNTFDFTATAVAGTDLNALNSLLEPGQSLVSGWNFTAVGSGYSASDPIYLSLGIPASLNHGNVQLWRQTSGNWSRFTADDLSAVDGYASFTITGLNGYAVAAFLPSPAWKADADGLWQSGSNWTTDPSAPGGVNTAAVLGPAITAPHTVTLAAPLTLGVLTFDNAQHYTLSGTEELKLQVNPTYTAEIEVKQSDANGHIIETPITLSSPLEITLAPSSSLTLSGQIRNPTGHTLTLSGGGTLTVAHGLATTGTIHVQSGTLNTPRVTADTLTIGASTTPPLAAVPEPCSLLLLLAATAAIATRFLRARRYSAAG